MTTYRVTWTPPGAFAPEWHDYRYQPAAEVAADIKRRQGCGHVEVIELEETP